MNYREIANIIEEIFHKNYKEYYKNTEITLLNDFFMNKTKQNNI